MTSGEEQLYPGNNNGSRDDTNKEIGMTCCMTAALLQQFFMSSMIY